MIKPGTICMIRGMPKTSAAYAAEGRIVQVVQYIGNFTNSKGNQFDNVHQFAPFVTVEGQNYNKAQEKWLHPLDDFEDELNREKLDEVLENTFRESLEKELEKLTK